MRRGPWKLLQNTPFEKFQLFNLIDDPLESIDVSNKHRPIVRELTEALRRHVQEAAQVPWQQSTSDEDSRG